VTRIVDDLKSSLILSGLFAVLAASAVPLLVLSMPPEAGSLPLPLPVFCAVLAVQLALAYGILGLAGFRLARSRGLEPAPVLTALWTPNVTGRSKSRVVMALVAGLGCGVLLVAAVATIQRYLPGTLPGRLHPPGIAAALVASAAGSLGEEILFRLFLLSLFLRVLPEGRAGAAAAVGISALAFGAAHAPALVFLFGGWREVPLVSWGWLIALNGLCGATYGVLFLRYGIVSAAVAHLGTDVVWHAASQLLPA
jgi:hypothetical protein